MAKVIGVRFKRAGKIYYFDPDDKKVEVSQHVIVETVRGIEYGEVVLGEREVEESELNATLKKVIRVATEEDAKTVEENLKKRQKHLPFVKKRLATIILT